MSTQQVGTSAAFERQWLTDVDLEAMTGRSRRSWRKDRLLMRGPRYRKFAGSVRYHISDFQAWVNSCPSGGAQPNAN